MKPRGIRGLVGSVAAGVLLTTFAAAPAFADGAALTAVGPEYGPVGTLVDLTGTGLTTATDVTFNGVDAGAPTVVDDTHVQVTVPDGASTGPVVVTTADGSPSIAFTVQVPTEASVDRTPATVTYPDGAVIRAELSAAGLPVSDQPAHLQRTAPGHSAWTSVQGGRQTNDNGRVHWSVHPSKAYAYRVVFDDVPAYLGGSTGRTRVAVRPLVLLHAPDVQPVLTDFDLRGRVRPGSAHHGPIVLQQKLDGAWQKVATDRIAADGRFSFATSYTDTGRYVYRTHRPHTHRLAAATSERSVVHAVQRELHSGMSGPDVRALQHRLRELHYDVGGISGTYDYDTFHAVVAFEKVQGLQRDGVVGGKVWRKLDDPRKPRLRHPEDAASTGVEVDLTKQVVYYAVHGRVARVIDASSGGGYTYTGSDGTQQQAITPTGHYHFIYKYDGWQTAPLGELYRPAYFRSDGYAIHGSRSVPSYPASHGCVRVTVPAMDRFYDRFVPGMSVWLYRS